MWYAGLALGLASSAHCVLMCGPLHLALAQPARPKARFWQGQLAYHLGRTATYAALGLAVGLLGQVGAWWIPRHWMALGAACLMALMIALPNLLPTAGPAHGVQRLVARVMRQVRRASLPGQGLAGACNGLLPCGTLYLALAASLAMPSWQGSVGFMASFGLGTFPLLLGLMVVGQPLLQWGQRWTLARVAVSGLVVAFVVFRGLAPVLTGPEPPPTAGQPAPILCIKPHSPTQPQ